MMRLKKKNILLLLLVLILGCAYTASAYAAPLTWTEQEFYELNIREALDLSGYSGKYTVVLSSDKENYIVSVQEGLEDEAYSVLKKYGINMKPIKIEAITITQLQSSKAEATGNVNVRSGPGTDYAKLGQLRRGQSVTVEAMHAGNWAQISWDGRTAYVSGSYLRFSSSAASEPGATRVAVSTANVNVRTGPGTSYRKIDVLPRGDSVTVWQVIGKWAQVSWGTGDEKAYIHTDYLRF